MKVNPACKFQSPTGLNLFTMKFNFVGPQNLSTYYSKLLTAQFQSPTWLNLFTMKFKYVGPQN